MRSKLLTVASALAIATIVLLASCGGGNTAVNIGGTNVTVPNVKGGIPDVIQFTVTTQRELGLKDVQNGTTDIFHDALNGPDYLGFIKTLSPEDQQKIETYAVPAGSWAVLVNPAPNAAPYIQAVDKKEIFNPFAIREVRYALNWLWSRKKINEEILQGTGIPMFTAITPTQPGSYRYGLLASKLGMKEDGDEAKAIADITAELTKAAQLPELKGKLVQKDGFWNFKGQPIIVKFIIRSDDPKGRLIEGRYLADQIEKAGIKVERMEIDRTKASAIYSRGDPSKMEWNFYTEGWGAGGTVRYYEGNIQQMYAPFAGNMVGKGGHGFQYKNDEIDALVQKVMNGAFTTDQEYWDSILKATELGLKDAVRIYIASQNNFYTGNKARFATRLVYGLGDGPNEITYYTANIAPTKYKDASGKESDKRVLHVKLYSARGSLFMQGWDPIYPYGYNDVWASAITNPTRELGTNLKPNSGAYESIRSTWKDIKTDFEFKKNADGVDIPYGKIAVPATSIAWDPVAKVWGPVSMKDPIDPAITRTAGKDLFVTTSSINNYKYSKWHNGVMSDLSDVMYATAFSYDWSYQNGPADKAYDEDFASYMEPTMSTVQAGIQANKDGSYTAYYNYMNPVDPDRVGATGTTLATPGAGLANKPMPWDVTEALVRLVLEGGKDAKQYAFNGNNELITEIDVRLPLIVEDIKMMLQKMIDEKYVPASLKDYTTADKAVARYTASLKFINTYGHAHISNGPYFISKISGEDFIELTATRDDSYPFTAVDWTKRYLMDVTTIDNENLPAAAPRGTDLVITLSASQRTYPADIAVEATNKVIPTVIFIASDNKETAFTGKFVKAGELAVTVPATELGKLAAGTYTVIIQTQIADEAPSIVVKTINLE